MENDIFTALEPVITERLNNVFSQDQDYKQAVQEESIAYGKLMEGLTENQQKLLEEYFNAVNATVSVLEKLAYRQGIRDLAAILGLGSTEI